MEKGDHHPEHVWAICRLTERFVAQWDRIYPVLVALEEADVARERTLRRMPRVIRDRVRAEMQLAPWEEEV